MTPVQAMSLAIDEAKKGLGFVAPNPPVGCVILDSKGELIGKGYHKKYGSDHAEIDALKSVQDVSLLKGATVYVTLEPCAHEGKTPSCAKHLAKLPIAKLVYGVRDPNPKVNGLGAEIVRSAGIEVEEWTELNPTIETVKEHFLWEHREKKPFISVKIATTMDGMIAHKNGESKWITNEKSRLYSHFLRALHDGIAIGKTTLLRDNPSLNVRHPDFMNREKKVFVFDSSAESLSQRDRLNIFKVHKLENIFYVVDKHKTASLQSDIQLMKLSRDQNGLPNLADFVNAAAELNLQSLFIEGGAQLLAAFMNSGHVQRFYHFIAPQIIGPDGIHFAKYMNQKPLENRIKLRDVTQMSFDQDILITGRI